MTSDGAEDSYGTEPGDPSRALRVGGVGERLSPEAVTEFVARALAGADLDAKRICLVVPDGTRTCPLPLILRACHGPDGGPRGHRGDRSRTHKE